MYSKFNFSSSFLWALKGNFTEEDLTLSLMFPGTKSWRMTNSPTGGVIITVSSPLIVEYILEVRIQSLHSAFFDHWGNSPNSLNAEIRVRWILKCSSRPFKNFRFLHQGFLKLRSLINFPLLAEFRVGDLWRSCQNIWEVLLSNNVEILNTSCLRV